MARLIGRKLLMRGRVSRMRIDVTILDRMPSRGKSDRLLGTHTTHGGRFGGTLNVLANSFAPFRRMRQAGRKTIADGGLIDIPDVYRWLVPFTWRLAASTPRAKITVNHRADLVTRWLSPRPA
jgi:hypothetical protein